MNFKNFALFWVLLLAAMAGCGEPTVAPEDVYHPERLQGTVDKSLPAELQAKQEILAEALSVGLEGNDIEDVSEYVSGVDFEEPTAAFLDGAIGLSRWEFGGKPDGNDVPVVLFLDEDGPDKEDRRVERVYTVTGSSQRATIRRKASP